MSKKNYDIDDILLEAEKLKEHADKKAILEQTAQLETQLKYDTSKISLRDENLDFNTDSDNSGDKAGAVSSKPKEKRPEKNRDKKEFDFGKAPTSASQEPASKSPKKDLFDFKPEKRERPIKVGPYGQKSFDFSKPETTFREELEEAAIREQDANIPAPEYFDQTFDFDSISDKIDQMNQIQEDEEVLPSQHTPFNFKKPVKSISEKAKARNKYADLASSEDSRSFKKFSFNFNKTAGQLRYDDNDEVETEVEEEVKEKRKSIFSTFTGTGKELKLEDIKRIDFSEVEGAGGGALSDNDYYYGDSEIPDGTTMSFSEFEPETDRRDISKDIATKKMGYFTRTILTGVLTVILFYFVLSAKFAALPMLNMIQPEGETLKAYFMACTVLTALVGAVSWNTVWSGLLSTFTMKANSDALPTFAIIGAVIQGFIAVRNPDIVLMSDMSLYFPVAALSMLFNSIGKMIMLNRIQQNFRITASNQEKKTILSVDSPTYARDLLKNHTPNPRPTVAYGAKADFFTDFMALSSSNRYDVGINRAVVPVCLIAAVVVAIITRMMTSNPMTSATAFAGVLCICSTFSNAFIENIPLNKMSQKLTAMGAMVSGNKAVETFCDTDGVILTENDLFPKGHVYLNGIKAFPNARIDEAILDSASVLCALDGAVSHVFLDMIGGNRNLLKKVDNVVYENGLGLSGWVDERRVLIGNRELMEHHGLTLPQDSYERAHPNDTPGNPIYVSNSGEVSARFLVEYLADEELAGQLELMAEHDKQLIVYTTDANIDEKMIWQLYGYPMDLITIMPSELQDEYREISQPRKEAPAEAVFIGRPVGFIAAILATINARSSILSATIIQFAQIIIGYGVVTLMSFMGYIESFSMLQLTLYQIFWFVAIMIVQQSRKP